MARNDRRAAAAVQRSESPAAPAVKTEKNSRATVTIAFKMPIAYFEMQLCRAVKKAENTQTGPRDVTEYVPTGDVITIRGTAYPAGTPPAGMPEKPQMLNGFALNYGISKEFWEAWREQHKRDPMVIGGLIVAHENFDHVRGTTKELKGVRSGLEPVNPLKDDRVPRSTNVGVTSPEIEEGRRAAAEKALAAIGEE